MILSMALLNVAAFAAVEAAPAVVPKPVKMECLAGAFTLDDATRVTFPAGDAAAEAAAAMLGEALRPATGLPLAAGPGEAGPNSIHLRTEETGLGPEGYRLEVAGDRALITGAAGPGLFYGVQTLRQLTRVHGAQSGLVLDGFVGVGEASRANRSHQSFFLNGRAMRSELLSRAVEEA